MKKYMSYGGKKFAAGGAMPMEQLTEFNEGGRHEENSLGGIPQGMNPEGQMNLVEEGETKFDAENYIFSDTLKVDKELADAFNLNPKTIGKTFADASKIVGRKKSKREGDAIEEAANNADLENLMEAQEAFKQARIEEKLQEIAELDPDALPALMGQGQDPNMMQDPAMGGQMQEAPMDEQAMMEQQMMAEQGQLSPEEMAMMQQQQDMMMGQEEGMMKTGGKLPKEVLRARVESHMSPAEADAYVKNYSSGGKMPKSVLLSRAKSHMSDEAAKEYVKNYAKGGKMDFKPHMMYKDGQGVFADTYKQHLNLKNLGYGHTMGTGGYTTRSYNPGGFMETTDTLGDPPSSTSTTSRTNSVGDGDFTYKFSDNSVEKRNPLNSFYENRGFQKEYVMDPNNPEVTQQVFIDPNDPKQSKLTGNRVKMFRMAKKGKLPVVQGEYDGSYAMGGNLTMGGNTNPPFNPPFNIALNPMPNTTPTLEEAQYMTLRTGADGKRSPSAGPKKYFDEAKATLSPTEFEAYKQNLAIGNPNLGMRRGGKMCYGCGGAMHNYGGRLMTNYREDEEFDLGGKIARGLGTAMKTAGNLIPIPGLNTAVAMGGAALENVGTGADAKEVLKDTALAALPGVAGGLVSGLELPASVKEKAVKGAKKVAGTVAGVVQDNTADSDKSQIQRNQILESGTPEQQAEVRKQMKEEEGIAKIGSTFGNLFKPQTEEEEENQDLIARYGKKFYRAGGLWANIHAKRKRIAAGSGEKMRKPGSKGAPTAEALKNSQNALGGRMYYPGGQMQFMPNFAGPEINDKKVKEEIEETNELKNMYPDISEALKKSPLEKIGMYAPIAKNLYNATLAKSKDYTPDFVPAEYIEMNPAQAIQQEKQRNAAVINAARSKGFNTPSMLLALNQQLQGTVSNIQAAYDQNNAKIKQAKLDKDNAQLKELKKIEKELQMRLDEAKNAAFNEALIQGKEIAENNTANKLAALYAMMGAPDMGQSFLGGKTLRQLKKEKRELEKEIQRKEKNKKV